MSQRNDSNLEVIEDPFYDYPDKPVPQDKKRSGFNIAAVTTGMAVAMSTLYTGASLALIADFKTGFLSIIIGCIVLGVFASLTGFIGSKSGVSFSMVARIPFGINGAKLVGLIFGLSMLGWFSYQTAYFGETVHALAPNFLLTQEKIAIVWGGILMMTTAVIGYKGMTYLSYIASPLLLVLCVVGAGIAINKYGLEYIINKAPSNPQSLGVGMTVVIGGWITGATLQPDISRFAKSGKDNGVGVFIAMIIFAIANLGGFIIAKATMANTVIEGLISLEMGVVALLIVILGQWTSNDNNLYSAALAIISMRKKPTNKHFVTAICGVVFTIIALFGIQEHFVDFLSFLGAFLPPFGSVLVVDYFFKDGRKELYKNITNDREYKSVNFMAFVAVIIGGISSIVINYGSPAINSILITGLFYFVLSKIIK